MPTTVEDLRTLFESGQVESAHRLQFKPSENGRGFDFRAETATYTNRYGENSLVGWVRISEDSRSVFVEAPSAFHLQPGQDQSVAEFCLRAQMQEALVRYSLDEGDGELRPAVHLILGDGQLEGFALGLMVYSVISACENLSAVISGTGPVFHDRNEG